MKKTPLKGMQPQDKTPTGTPIESDIPQNTPPVEQPIKKTNKSLQIFLPLVLAAVVFAIAFPKVQTIISEAAAKKCVPIAKVMLNPGIIDTFTKSRPTNVSVLAYDRYNRPIWRGVTYEWGISSINGVGTVKTKHDLATFIPLRAGTGDLYVKTTNDCTPRSVIGSVKITIKQGVAPTPTIRKKK